MSERFRCERCGRGYAVSGALSGRSFRMRCRGCGTSIAYRPADLAPAPAPEERPAEEFEVVLEEPSPPGEQREVAPVAEAGTRQASASPGGAVRTASRARP